ncbi:patatin-like phospholipase family protein [Thiomicrospira sp. WB1]|uniref:patatin-like phospholipase family protein n=1 Tax=Thiomicrospira sp. WB1 TaxID=1685380 RepID=UPI000746EA4D|nr:patatin-like phospholipase family protein [Thiomicrospira sp. WB1]KUJ72650.1 serine protease [Thiomicrospira sp. WB1]
MRIALVLGSGGARGLAHIGVIRWLEEQNIEIGAVSGASIGALVGGAYAAGRLDQLEAWGKDLDKLALLKLLDISWQKNGLVKGRKLLKTLKKLLGDVQIEDLPIAYTAVATDIEQQKEIWLRKGGLAPAIRASISLPLFFTPYALNRKALVDGGVLNPVPIAPVFGESCDRIVAVSLSGESQSQARHHPVEEAAKPKKQEDWVSAIYSKVRGFFNAGDQTAGPEWGPYEIADLAFDSMQNTIARQKLAAYPPDDKLEIASDVCGMLEFDRAEEMIHYGYEQAAHQLAHLVDQANA